MTTRYVEPSVLLVILLLVPSALLPVASSSCCTAEAFADPTQKLNTSITIQYSYVGEYPIPMNNSITLLGHLTPKINGTGTLYWSIEGSGFIYQRNVTFINGESETPFNFTTPGSWTFKIAFSGDDAYNGVESSLLGMNIAGDVRLNTTLTMAASTASSTAGSNVTLSGSLSMPYNSSVLLYRSVNGSAASQFASATLVLGSYSHNTTLTGPGTYSYYAVWGGNGAFNPATSGSVTVASQAAEQPSQPAGGDSTTLIVAGVVAAAAVAAALLFFLRRKK